MPQRTNADTSQRQQKRGFCSLQMWRKSTVNLRASVSTNRLLQQVQRPLEETDLRHNQTLSPKTVSARFQYCSEKTVNGAFVALDARLTIDDNALFRHLERVKNEAKQLTPQEEAASKYNLAYVKLEGNIGVIGNGAGLVMATLDLLSLFGGEAADFLDLGGGASVEQINAATKLVLSDSGVRAVLINVLGGITRCDEVAKGILQAKSESGSEKPLIVRLIGTNQQEGQSILQKAGIHVYDSMEEAANQAVQIANMEDP